MIFYGAGIKFNKFNPKKKYFDINKYLKENPNGRPLLIFPEATKSNRLAVLPIRSNLMDDIYKKAKENKINIRSEIIINKNYEINTTDTLGIKSLFNLCSCFYTNVEICSQDIKNENFSEENIDYDKSKYDNFNLYLDSVIQEYLMENLDKFDSSYEVMAAIILIHNRVRIKTQFQICGYQVDFLLPDDHVILEIDGDRHKYNKTYDSKRDKHIKDALGPDWEIIRISTECLDMKATKLIDAIEGVLDYRHRA
jgi:very-short-patch-repair endonuclease